MDERESVWSVTDRSIFSLLFVAFFIGGGFLRLSGRDDFQLNFTIVADVGAIGLFAVTCSFVLLEVRDVMLGVHEAVKQWNLKRGLQRGREEGLVEGREEGLVEGREEGRKERDELVRKWYSEERAKGSEGFREPPPFLDNGYRD
ncbi:MAG: hypothetical protein OXU79_08550 [Gemmatimonadota bacterium]|nr:hypothetical protein [Gemmatimonadota bacterium]